MWVSPTKQACAVEAAMTHYGVPTQISGRACTRTDTTRAVPSIPASFEAYSQPIHSAESFDPA